MMGEGRVGVNNKFCKVNDMAKPLEFQRENPDRPITGRMGRGYGERARVSYLASSS